MRYCVGSSLEMPLLSATGARRRRSRRAAAAAAVVQCRLHNNAQVVYRLPLAA